MFCDNYFDSFIPSEEMREFLKKRTDVIDSIPKIVYFSPCAVDKKMSALQHLEFAMDDTEDSHPLDDCKIYLRSLVEAKRFLDEEGVFSLEICRADDDKTSYGFDSVFATYQDLMDYIRNYMELGEIGEEECICFDAVKWIKDNSGKYVKACEYWIVRGEIWYVQVNRDFLDDYRLEIYNSVNLNLPIPFVAGDVVECDFYPFAGKKSITILEVGDNHDCCCVQGLYRGADEKWGIGAVKHGHVGINAVPCVSPLYTMRKLSLKKMEYSLVELMVSKYIARQEKKGKKLSDELNHSDFSTAYLVEKVRELMEG